MKIWDGEVAQCLNELAVLARIVRFSFHHPCGGLQCSTTEVPGDPTCILDFSELSMCTQYTYKHTNKTSMHI